MNYDPDLFEATTAAQVLADVRGLLESVVDDPEQQVSALPLGLKGVSTKETEDGDTDADQEAENSRWSRLRARALDLWRDTPSRRRARS